MGRHGGRPSLDRFPGCKGLQPSKVNNGLRGPDHDLEGAGPSAPRSSIETLSGLLRFGMSWRGSLATKLREAQAPPLQVIGFPAARNRSPQSQ